MWGEIAMFVSTVLGVVALFCFILLVPLKKTDKESQDKKEQDKNRN